MRCHPTDWSKTALQRSRAPGIVFKLKIDTAIVVSFSHGRTACVSAAPHQQAGKAFELIPAFKIGSILLAAERRRLECAVGWQLGPPRCIATTAML
jgi:hypothetical protein